MFYPISPNFGLRELNLLSPYSFREPIFLLNFMIVSLTLGHGETIVEAKKIVFSTMGALFKSNHRKEY